MSLEELTKVRQWHYDTENLVRQQKFAVASYLLGRRFTPANRFEANPSVTGVFEIRGRILAIKPGISVNESQRFVKILLPSSAYKINFFIE